MGNERLFLRGSEQWRASEATLPWTWRLTLQKQTISPRQSLKLCAFDSGTHCCARRTEWESSSRGSCTGKQELLPREKSHLPAEMGWCSNQQHRVRNWGQSMFCSSCCKAASFQILRLLTRLHAVSGGHCQQEERVWAQEHRIVM